MSPFICDTELGTANFRDGNIKEERVCTKKGRT